MSKVKTGGERRRNLFTSTYTTAFGTTPTTTTVGTSSCCFLCTSSKPALAVTDCDSAEQLKAQAKRGPVDVMKLGVAGCSAPHASHRRSHLLLLSRPQLILLVWYCIRRIGQRRNRAVPGRGAEPAAAVS